MVSANLQQWIQHPETLNKDSLYELRTLISRYPYFQSLRLLYLKNLYLLHDVSFGAELRNSISYVADRRKLFYLIEGDRYVLKPRIKEEVPQTEALEEDSGVDRTLSLIDAFLSTVPEEVSAQTNLDYTTDYTTYLLQEDDAPEQEDTPKLRGHELIDGFIERSEDESSVRLQSADENKAVPVEEEGEMHREDDEDDSCFTETLAKIYVKQHRYSKALEIIKKLSLKYPKKNAYFADQIRFLEKLIINAKSK